MPKKHKPIPPKAPEEEEEEISTPISSQPFSQKPNSNKSTSHPNQTHKPHTASTSSEEVEEEGEEEEEGEAEEGGGGEEEEEEEIDREEVDEETEDSETEKTNYIATLSKPTQPTKQKEQQEEEDSDYDQDSASGSSSESSSRSPKSNKPISSKKIDRHPKPKKPQTNSDGAAPSRKRPQAAAEANENGSKKQKLESEQPAFFWRPEDEITLLKGMMEFAERGNSDASSDKDGFHRFINKLLTVKVTRRQLVGKISHTRQKYRTEVKKAREGIKPVFSKPHHKLKYQLSKKLWGENDPTLEDDGDDDDIEVENGNGVDTLNTVEKGGGNAKKGMSMTEKKCGGNVKRRQKKSQNDDFLLEEVDSEAVLYPHLNELLRWSSGIARVSGLSESDVKRAFQLMSPSQVKELDLQWRKLQLKERDIRMERLSLAYDLTKQFYDLVKSSEV